MLLLGGCADVVFGSADPGPGDTGVVDDDDDSVGLGDCCSAHDDPSCNNPIISSCVCGMDPTCCEQGWDAKCAASVESLGCGQCTGGGDCCDVGLSPGCESLAVQDCVCAVDPFCCADAWDEQCVADVFLFECGMCPGGTSSCCAADGSPGCADGTVQQCVCGQDPACCIDGWDFQCVQEVDMLGCGQCESEGSSSTSATRGSASGSGPTSGSSASAGTSSSSSSSGPGETDTEAPSSGTGPGLTTGGASPGGAKVVPGRRSW